MTDSTTNRTETDILTRARDDLRLLRTGGYEHTADLVEGLIGEVGDARRLWVKAEADLIAAHDVIRRLRDGWYLVDGFQGREWHGPDGDLEATSAAHDEVLDAVAGPNDTEENR